MKRNLLEVVAVISAFLSVSLVIASAFEENVQMLGASVAFAIVAAAIEYIAWKQK